MDIAAHALRRLPPGLRRTLATSVVALGLGAGAGACASDDAARGLPTAVCDAVVGLDAATALVPQDPADVPAFVERSLLPHAETLMLRGDDEEQRYAGETVYGTLLRVIDTGDVSLLSSSDTVVARARIGEAAHGGCRMNVNTVVARDHSFDGALHTFPPGRVGFAMWNEGREEHEMVLLRAADGVTEALDDLLRLPEDEMRRKMELVAATAGGPGTKRYMAVDLHPGTYFLVCSLPLGGEGSGAPHFTAGMQHTFTVG